MRRIVTGIYTIGALATTVCGRADTVYLKNGAYIDGIVRARTAQTIDIQIGEIGKLEIPVSDVDSVEKNGRTGDGRVLDREGRPVDPKVAALIKQKEKESAGADKSKPEGKESPSDKEAKAEPAPTKEQEGQPEPAESEATEGEDGEEGDGAAEAVKPREPDISPALKAKILQHVEDLKRQKAQFRTRAERHLRAIGAPALPFIYPVTGHELEVARIAAMRLVSELGDETSIETCLARLLDPSEFVRDLANKTLERVTQQSFGFQAGANPRRREMAYTKWRKWWDNEKAELAATEKLKKESSR